jgi:hypothetical protein
MTFEADFRTFLLSSGTIAGLVGDRIVWSELPSGSPLPLVTLWTMAAIRPWARRRNAISGRGSIFSYGSAPFDFSRCGRHGAPV